MNTKTNTMNYDDELKKMFFIKIDPVHFYHLSDEAKKQLLAINEEMNDSSSAEFAEEDRRYREMLDREERYFEDERKKTKLREAKQAAKEAEKKIKAARDELGSDYESDDEMM
jgi:hypothetical protein